MPGLNDDHIRAARFYSAKYKKNIKQPLFFDFGPALWGTSSEQVIYYQITSKYVRYVKNASNVMLKTHRNFFSSVKADYPYHNGPVAGVKQQ